MSAVTNQDLFEDLYEFIKRSDVDLNAVFKEYGGCTYYIPSHKTTVRNDEICTLYKSGVGIKALARQFDLTERQILNITKELREPRLF